MAACDNIDLSKEQTNSILQNIEAMLRSNILPQTIVQYVCAELGTPDINETNYCIIPCVSSCVFSYATISGTPPVAIYRNIDSTITCINQCFPIFSTSSCSGSTTNTKSRGCSKNCNDNKKEQEKNMNKCRDKCIKSLMDQMIRCFDNLSIICSSYAMTLSMIAGHLSEITFANLTKRIGAAIDWISKVWKSIKDSANAIINWAKTAGEAATDEGAPTKGHLIKAAQDALTTLQGYLSDQLKNAGQYIEQIGQFLYDLSDRMWDIKEIAFCLKSLAAMINDVSNVINNITNRQNIANNACDLCISLSNSTYDMQFNYTDAMDEANLSMAAMSEIGLNNLKPSQADIYLSTDIFNISNGISIS
jgi:hypothetical protein